jgi:polar amino acid transport system substrate-binding protein
VLSPVKATVTCHTSLADPGSTVSKLVSRCERDLLLRVLVLLSLKQIFAGIISAQRKQLDISMHRLFSYAITCVIVYLSVFPGQSVAGPVIERIRTNQELVLGTPGDFPPFSVISELGDLIGFDVSLARELAKSMGVNLRIERLPFSELISTLKSGQVDMIMSGLSVTPKRNMDIAFVGPYGNSGQAFIGQKEIIESLGEPKDLNRADLKIGALQDTTAELTLKALMPQAEPVLTKSLDEVLIKLLRGEIDGLISDYPYCKVAEYRYKSQGLLVYDKILSFEQLGIGVLPDDPLFVNLLTNYLNLLVGSGALKAMQEYWFKSSDWIVALPDLTIFKDF